MQLLSAQVPGQFGAREQKSFAMRRSSSWSVMFGLDSAQAHFDQNSEFPLRRTLQLASLPWPKGCCCTRVLSGIGGYITPNSQKSIYFFLLATTGLRLSKAKSKAHPAVPKGSPIAG